MGHILAKELPDIIAPALSLKENESLDGKLNPKEITVVALIDQYTVNGKDFELIIFAHDFPERLSNLSERREKIQQGVRSILCRNVYDVTASVCIMATQMSYGEMLLTIKDTYGT